MVFMRRIHVKWDFEDCLVFLFFILHQMPLSIQPRMICWSMIKSVNQSSTSFIVIFCLCAVAEACLNEWQVCLSIFFIIAAFLALKEPSDYNSYIPVDLQAILEKENGIQQYCNIHLRTFTELNLVGFRMMKWLYIFYLFKVLTIVYIFCLTVL